MQWIIMENFKDQSSCRYNAYVGDKNKKGNTIWMN